MTEQTNADLIATAKAMREQMGEEPKSRSILALWFETADALETTKWERDLFKREQVRLAYRCDAAQDERNQLAAVVEKVRVEVGHDTPPSRIERILAAAPADTLREHDAKVRAEALKDVRQAIREIPYWYDPGTGTSGFDLQPGGPEGSTEDGARDAVCDALIRLDEGDR